MKTTARPAAWWARTRLRLQVPHTKHVGWPFGKSIRARRPSKVVRAVTTGSSPTPSALERGLDEEAEPVGDDLDRDARRLRPPDERHETRVVRLRRGRREERGGRASTSAISSSISRREPIRPAS